MNVTYSSNKLSLLTRGSNLVCYFQGISTPGWVISESVLKPFFNAEVVMLRGSYFLGTTSRILLFSGLVTHMLFFFLV